LGLKCGGDFSVAVITRKAKSGDGKYRKYGKHGRYTPYAPVLAMMARTGVRRGDTSRGGAAFDGRVWRISLEALGDWVESFWYSTEATGKPGENVTFVVLMWRV
jgi:hypothetical protein